MNAVPGVEALLAQAEKCAEKGVPPCEGTAAAIGMAYIDHLRSRRTGKTVARGVINRLDAEDISHDAQCVPLAPDIEDMIAEELRGSPRKSAEPLAQPPERPKGFGKLLVQPIGKALVWLTGLLGVSLVDVGIFKFAIDLAFPEIRGVPMSADNGWLAVVLLPVVIASYFKLRATNGRLRRWIDILSNVAILVMLVAAGVFVATSVLSSLGGQGFSPPPALDGTTNEGTAPLTGGALSWLSYLGLGLVLSVTTIASFFAIHAILNRLHDLYEEIISNWDQYRRDQERCARACQAIAIDADIDRLDAMIAEAPRLIAVTLSTAVQPAITAHEVVLGRLRVCCSATTEQMELMQRRLERLRSGSDPTVLESYVRTPVASR